MTHSTEVLWSKWQTKTTEYYLSSKYASPKTCRRFTSC